MKPDPLASIAGHRYMNLTTFRKSGQAVTSPVWFAQEGDTLYVYTGAASGKVKRIRNSGAVEVGPSSATGKPLGPSVAARARILGPDEAARADTLISTRYGWQKRVAMLLNRLRRNIGPPIYLAITPA
jgi:PPOX class probable F420-dependent enzyme